MPAAVSNRYTGITTTGAQAPLMPAPGGIPFHKYGVQVKGVGGTLTSWSVTLEGSLDGANWTVLITHTTTDGSTQWTTEKPCTWVRANVGALSLGTATSINVFATATG